MYSIEQFEKQYIQNSKITEEFYHKYFVTLPCNCEAEQCKGFAAICKDNIAMHITDCMRVEK